MSKPCWHYSPALDAMAAYLRKHTITVVEPETRIAQHRGARDATASGRITGVDTTNPAEIEAMRQRGWRRVR